MRAERVRMGVGARVGTDSRERGRKRVPFEGPPISSTALELAIELQLEKDQGEERGSE